MAATTDIYFLAVLEAERSEIKKPTDSVPAESSLAGLPPSPVSSFGRIRVLLLLRYKPIQIRVPHT